MVFPGSSAGKDSACNVWDLGSIPGVERSPGGGHGNPLQYSCLENPRGQRSLVGYSPWGKSRMNKHSTYILFNVIIHYFILTNFQTIPNENEFLRKQFSLVDLDITFICNRFSKNEWRNYYRENEKMEGRDKKEGGRRTEGRKSRKWIKANSIGKAESKWWTTIFPMFVKLWVL